MSIDRTNWTALVDDDGSNTVGTLWTKDKVKTVLLDPIDLAITTVQTTTSTGTVNDFGLTAACTLLRCNNATLLTLTGLTAGTDGQRLQIVSIGAGQVDLANQAVGSTAANRIINSVTGTISLSPGSGTATLAYDATTARWRVVHHNQGAWITPVFAAGNFTASGSQTWTLQSGDQVTYAYMLNGRTMTVAWYLDTTTVGGTPSDQLRIALPTGFTANLLAMNPFRYSDNGGAASTGEAFVQPGINYITLRTASQANWTASTNNTHVHGEITFEVQ